MQDPTSASTKDALPKNINGSSAGLDLRFLLNRQWPALSPSSDDGPNNLRFQRGDLVTVLGHNAEDGRWYGEANGKRGRFQVVRVVELDLITEAAEAGNPSAQNELGRRVYHGFGLPADEAMALSWFQKAADGGNAYAQFNLGMCYEHSLCGAPRDLDQAVRWYRLSADQGDAYAQYNLAQCYAHGFGVEKDAAAALHWHLRASQQGDIDAQIALAGCYLAGDDLEWEAVHWLHEAKMQGSEVAASDLKNTLTRLGVKLSKLA